MVISSSLREAMIAHARGGFPNEACGLLASDGGRIVEFFPVINADASPVHYLMDSADQLRALMAIDDAGWDLGAIYHSHTHSRAYPSATDVTEASVTLEFYPGTTYIIVSLADPDEPDMRAYKLDGGAIAEEPIQVEAG